MDSTAPVTEKSSGLATYLAVLTAPRAAFAQLARTPTWGWAAIIGIALMVAAMLISFPEQLKIAHIAQQQALASMSGDQRAQAEQNMAAAEGITQFSIRIAGFIAPWLIWVISAIVLTIGAAIAGGTARFSLAWVACVNASAVAFVGAVVNAVILALRGPDAIGSPIDAYALPSLAMLVHDNIKLAVFLAQYNVISIWFYVVAAIALEQTLKVRRPAAIVTTIVYSLISAGFAAAFAK